MRPNSTPVAVLTVVIVSAIAADVLLGACSPWSPSVLRLTVSITENGVSPASISEQGRDTTEIEFVNRDSQGHDIRSDPHVAEAGRPAHSSYPGLNIGVLAPGQSKTATHPGVGVSSYHDETRPDDVRFQGRIATH